MNNLRGKCKELAEDLCRKNTNLVLCRGYFLSIVFGPEQHWWAKDKTTGKIHDPSVSQFPDKVVGDHCYEEISNDPKEVHLNCEECGKEITEQQVMDLGIETSYPVCSGECFRRMVGV